MEKSMYTTLLVANNKMCTWCNNVPVQAERLCGTFISIITSVAIYSQRTLINFSYATIL